MSHAARDKARLQSMGLTLIISSTRASTAHRTATLLNDQAIHLDVVEVSKTRRFAPVWTADPCAFSPPAVLRCSIFFPSRGLSSQFHLSSRGLSDVPCTISTKGKVSRLCLLTTHHWINPLIPSPHLTLHSPQGSLSFGEPPDARPRIRRTRLPAIHPQDGLDRQLGRGRRARGEGLAR